MLYTKIPDKYSLILIPSSFAFSLSCLNDNKEFLCDGECLFFTGKGKIRAAGSDEAGAGRVKRQITQENLEKMIAYNVSNQKNYALRVVPLFLKKPAISLYI